MTDKEIIKELREELIEYKYDYYWSMQGYTPSQKKKKENLLKEIKQLEKERDNE